MAEIRGKFVYRDDLTPGRSQDGGLSQLLYDDQGHLTDHGTFIPDDEDAYEFEAEPEPESLSPEEMGQAIGALIGVALVVVAGAIQAAPHVKHWWQDEALPRLKNLFTKKQNPVPTATDLGRSQPAATQMAAITPVAPVDFSKAVDVALEDSRTRMGSEEAQRRLAAMLAASAFIAEQMRMLSNARLEDDADLPELQSAMEKLTAQQVTDSVNRMLEANTSLLDERASAEFMRMFGGGGIVDGQYVPVRNEKIKDALRLTDGRTYPDTDDPGALTPA